MYTCSKQPHGPDVLVVGEALIDVVNSPEVVTTLGVDGSLLMTPHGSVHVPAFPSLVVDTIGAGDSYMAALIYGLLARGTHGLAPQVQETPGRTAAAAAAAAITVSRKGAAPLKADELPAWRQQASIPS